MSLSMMHQEMVSYVGSMPSERIVIVADRNQQTRMSAILGPGRVVLPQQAATLLRSRTDVAVRLDIKQPNVLRDVLLDMAELQVKYLAIPSVLATEIYTTLLPKAVKVLEFTGPEVARVDASARVEGLTRLVGDRVKCEPQSFRTLLHTDIEADSAGVRFIVNSRQLRTVNAKKAGNSDFIKSLEGSELVQLGIRGASRVNLFDVSRMRKLVGLWVQDVRGELDLAPLAASEICELTIGYCSQVRNIDVLRDWTSLRRLHVFGCGDIGVEKAIRAVEGRFEVVVIDGSG
ncbi:MAG: hypothetical protein WBX15_01875 [Thermoanaerobaculia bacterium]